MRKAARLFGAIWMAGAVLAGIVLLGSGVFHSSRGVLYLLFGTALPGIFLFRWGSAAVAENEHSTPSRPRPTAPIDAAAEAGHVMHLDEVPIRTRETSQSGPPG